MCIIRTNTEPLLFFQINFIREKFERRSVTNDLWRRDVFPPPRPVRSTLREEIVCERKKWTRLKIVFFNSAYFFSRATFIRIIKFPKDSL